MTEEGRNKLLNTCNRVLMFNGASVRDPKFYSEVQRIIYDNIQLENEVKRLKDLLEKREDPKEAEVMITHTDGSVEYLKDVYSIGLISSKHFEITCYCEFVKGGDPE